MWILQRYSEGGYTVCWIQSAKYGSACDCRSGTGLKVILYFVSDTYLSLMKCQSQTKLSCDCQRHTTNVFRKQPKMGTFALCRLFRRGCELIICFSCRSVVNERNHDMSMLSLHWIPFSECFAFHRKLKPKLTDISGHRCAPCHTSQWSVWVSNLIYFDPTAIASCEVGRFCQTIVSSRWFRKALKELELRLKQPRTTATASPEPVPEAETTTTTTTSDNVDLPKTTTTTTSDANIDLPVSAKASDDS